MEHSIAARYAARQTARFVTPSAKSRERRLGLRGAGSFRPASSRLTVLHRPGGSVLARLRGDWRAIRPAHPRRTDGRPRPTVTMLWTGSSAGGASPRRSRRPACTVPWARRGAGGPHPPIQRRDGAVARLRTATATSAGGIVVRFDDGVPSLVVGARRRDRDIFTWTLPKGTPNADETREQTALREVAEETGLEVRITDVLDSIEYWFVQRGTRIHKTVHYFLMEPIGGDLSRHDHEFDQVRWVAFDQAPDLLTFETERTLVAKAAEVVDPGSGQRRAHAVVAPTAGAPLGGA